MRPAARACFLAGDLTDPPIPQTKGPPMYVLYDGPSLIDGTPIVVLATGIDMPSANRKTGPMVQTYIMARDIHPVEAVNTGADLAICGNCVHRGSRTRKRSCYVTVHQGPTSVWRAYQRNPKPAVPLNEIANLGRLRHIRLGAYGDPTAAPTEIWSHLLRHAQSHTGYTHLWRTCAPQFKAWCMASVDSASERREAKQPGVAHLSYPPYRRCTRKQRSYLSRVRAEHRQDPPHLHPVRSL